MDGVLAWLVLAQAQGVGRARLSALMQACPDPTQAWRIPLKEFARIDSWNMQAAQGAVEVRRNPAALRAAETEWDNAYRAGLRLVTLLDPDYPVILRLAPDPPPYFYQAGPWRPDARPVVAIVGSRKPTAYGLSVAERFGHELARMGAVVVSGMARGIDCAAHRGALEAQGTTIAVLGGGADICYPREAAAIYRQIKETGAIISEQPPGSEPLSRNFPERNRIISGLAHGIVVIEAGERSGTLITVSAALRQGREVFAVPGPITSPMSVGPHLLIRDGASLATSAEQVLDELGFPTSVPAGKAESREPLTSDEQRLLGWMGLGEPRWAGDLAEACGLSAREVQGLLTLLEVKGFARHMPGGQYVRVS